MDSPPYEAIERLFSYGTLQQTEVQLATFGRRLAASEDVLPGYRLSMLAIDDADVVKTSGKTHHPIISYTGSPEDSITGAVLAVSTEELWHADRYEVAAYRRQSVRLASGTIAWAYVDARDQPA